MTSEWRLIYQGLHLLTDNSKNCIGSKEWINIYVHVKQDFAINHPCSYFNGGLAEYTHQWAHTSHTNHGPVARYAKLGVAQAAGMPETFSPPLHVSDPDKHHGTCRDACRDRLLAVSFEIGGGENVPGAWTTRNFSYLVRGAWML